MNKNDGNWRFLLGGLYTWIVSVYFGVILLDIMYANLALNLIASSEKATLFLEVSDFLLIISIFPILAAICAIGSSWSIKTARNLFIASILALLIGFLAPLMLFPLIRNLQASLDVNTGPWVRLVGSALPSILAFAGLWKLSPSQS